MQIDPASLSRTDSITSTTAAAAAAKAAASTSGPATQKSTKALISVPRLDLEPIYTELKAAIGDNWTEYKQAITHFLLGMLDEKAYAIASVCPSGSLLWHNFSANGLLGFTTGLLNQSEFSSRVDHIILADAKTEHLHNKFVCAIIGNLTRDLPDHGVASWVSANDKPSVVSKPVSGDVAEQRLKTEIMQLPARDRKRIKSIPEVCLMCFAI